ncbi:MAG: tRNA (guanosine(37)-N1)-methyltransferase TrmD [Syntrophales bacterium LBB04]|nr:tRNA (guanosine(37)-N1)-methyltransferase TrmD [Syntrophales bacterium LBB04]
MRFDILSLFPEMFASPLQSSLLKRAREKGLIDVRLCDIRLYAEDKHKMTDDAPYGGGGGMVMKVEPIDRALAALAPFDGEVPVILLTPQGETFNQKMAEELSSYPRLVLICGHYEGVDERVREHLADRELSIGDYVITGGELSALVVVDAVSRLIPGVLGNSESAASDSFSMGILEYPQYTRPSTYKGWSVPDVLLSGNHAEIESWRRREALKRTWTRRRDLLKKAELTGEDDRMLRELEEAT